MPDELSYTRFDGAGAQSMLDELFSAYDEIYAGESYSDDPIFSRPQFFARTSDQAAREGFELVTLAINGELGGFTFGLPFPANSWWANASMPCHEIYSARKFAVIELGIRPNYRGRGLSRSLLAELLSRRTEDYATLAAIPESRAQAMYERWGWRKVGTIGGEGPVMDAMIVALGT